MNKCHVLTNNMGQYAACFYARAHHYHGVGRQHGMTLAMIGICKHKHQTTTAATACTSTAKP